MQPSIHLTPDLLAGLVFLVSAGIVFWWGFVASARAFARWRHGSRGLVVGGAIVAITAGYARVHPDWANLPVLALWIFLWGCVAAWARFGAWRRLAIGVERCMGKLRAALGARA